MTEALPGLLGLPARLSSGGAVRLRWSKRSGGRVRWRDVGVAFRAIPVERGAAEEHQGHRSGHRNEDADEDLVDDRPRLQHREEDDGRYDDARCSPAGAKSRGVDAVVEAAQPHQAEGAEQRQPRPQNQEGLRPGARPRLVVPQCGSFDHLAAH